jgi:hypothetical protein
MRFLYTTGQRPLDGYTVKRGIGKGGFGEVYYALSDGGKEVALKLIRSNLDVELRGISQCLNLKHPNLVNLYDLRTDAQGSHWVIMEYVSGESLHGILARHPQGVSADLAREWFLGLAGAVSYLHDHGIVHRDLKPGNIFIEQGMIKVGDYGLCKFIGGSQRGGQTQSVGTVHYMAPEISSGNYNRQVDIYAAGVMLYEMLTGEVPFDGESAAEILMKHLTSPPDLSKVPSPFVPILDKALSKNPALRYRTMAEMTRDLAATGAPKESPQLSVFRSLAPQPGPMADAAAATATATPVLPTARGRLFELARSLLLATGLAAALSLSWGALTKTYDAQTIAPYFFLTFACCAAVIVPAKWWTERVDDSWRRRAILLGLGLAVGLEALWLDGARLDAIEVWLEPARPKALPEEAPSRERHPFFGALYPENRSWPAPACYLSYFGLALFAMRWWRMAEPTRRQRFSIGAVLTAGFWAYILLFLLPGTRERQIGFVVLVLAAIIIQLVSPWQPPAVARARRVRLRYV